MLRLYIGLGNNLGFYLLVIWLLKCSGLHIPLTGYGFSSLAMTWRNLTLALMTADTENSKFLNAGP